MSKATSKTLTEAEQTERRERRAARREKRAARSRELADWLEGRRIASQKRHALKAKLRREKMVGTRGVDRVPESIQKAPRVSVNTVVKPELGVSVLPDGRKIQGPYAVRRAHGARGHKRRPRRRELTAYALAEMTKGERRILDAEMAKAEKAKAPMTDRQVRARCWSIMREARFPTAPRDMDAVARASR